jgi:spore maturation protein CgeB
MKIFVFGSSITSSYWNGAATYYRGIYKQLYARGHRMIFAEPDAYGRQENRDAEDFSYVTSIVYRGAAEIPALLEGARECELVIKHSGVGVCDELLEGRVPECRSPKTKVAFWDVDAPATLARLDQDPGDPFLRLIPEYDFVFTYGGGKPVAETYIRLGARNCHPIYNAVDPETHHAVPRDPALECDLLFMGHRLPDREPRVDEFFLRAAELAPELRFVLGGEGWAGKRLPRNVRWVGHLPSRDHNRANSSARMVLNINRASMADIGFSPPTRIFEAAGAAACVITDRWDGIEKFFRPNREILVAADAEEVVRYLRNYSRRESAEVGHNMRQRAIGEHTYQRRAAYFESIAVSRSSADQLELTAQGQG